MIEHARERGLLVIADGKRGDIALSARAYSQALFERLRVDLATVNPLLGGDAIEPFVTGARRRGPVCCCWCGPPTPAPPTCRIWSWRRAARCGSAWRRSRPSWGRWGSESRVSATSARWWGPPSRNIERARELMPHAVLLLPGVGAQGGRVEDLAPAFLPGRAGGLITASRSIVGAHLATGGDPAEAARAEAERLRAAAWALGV